MGDLNFNYIIDDTLHDNPIQYIEQLFNMSQLVTSPTRVTDHSSSTLDLILSTVPDCHKTTNYYIK